MRPFLSPDGRPPRLAGPDPDALGEPTRGTAEGNFAVHNYEDRSFNNIIPHDDLFLGQFEFEERNKRDEVHITADKVLGNFQERLIDLSDEQAQLKAAAA